MKKRVAIVVALVTLATTKVLQSQSENLLRLEQRCIEASGTSELHFTGNIFYKIYGDNSSGAELWMTDQTLVAHQIDPQILNHLPSTYLSGNLLAYVDYSTAQNIVVINGNGQRVATLTWKSQWDEPISWTLQRKLVVNNVPSDKPKDYGFSILTFGNNFLQSSHFGNFPFVNLISSEARPLFIVSPTGEQVVYDALLLSSLNQIQPGVVFSKRYPFVDKGILWHTVNERFANKVRWSPDGNQLVYTPNLDPDFFGWSFPYPTEIAVVDASGQEHMLTNFNQSSIHNDTFYTQYNLAWSPNGNMVAFWLLETGSQTREKADSTVSTLHVLNLSEKSVYDLCTVNSLGSLANFVWSPDSSMLIYSQGGNGGNVTIVNLDKNIDFTLALNAFNVISWLNNSTESRY